MTFTTTIPAQNSVFTINNSDTTWELATGQTISSTGYGITEAAKYHENIIKVDGGISAVQDGKAGIYTSGSETTVAIGTSGTIDGYFGILSYGTQFTLINHGSITGIDTAVVIGGDQAHLVSDGEIGGGIYADSANRLNIALGKGSEVTSTSSAIYVDNDASQIAHIVNHGSVTGTAFAFRGGAGNETFINRGTMDGDVSLGAGSDMFDGRGGSLAGNIFGDAGDDTFIVDSNIEIQEYDGGGTDTIKSAISMNLSTSVLASHQIENLALLGTKNLSATGNALDNEIKGNSGNNHLSGDTGDDILTGGKGADIFIFKTGFDNDTVHDFGNGADRIDLSDFSAVTGFADLMAHHVSKSGLDLIIHTGTDQLTLEHVSKADLQASDFIF